MERNREGEVERDKNGLERKREGEAEKGTEREVERDTEGNGGASKRERARTRKPNTEMCDKEKWKNQLNRCGF